MNDDDVLPDLPVEELDELREALDEPEEEEPIERNRRARVWRAPSGPNQRPSYQPPRPSRDNVTEVRINAIVKRVEDKIAANTKAIQQLSARVNVVKTAQDQQALAVRKQVTITKQQIANLKNSTQMASLLPIITQKTLEITADIKVGEDVQIPKGTKLSVQGADSLLPVLLLSGLGGGLGGGPGEDSGTNNLLTLVALSGAL